MWNKGILQIEFALHVNSAAGKHCKVAWVTFGRSVEDLLNASGSTSRSGFWKLRTSGTRPIISGSERRDGFSENSPGSIVVQFSGLQLAVESEPTTIFPAIPEFLNQFEA